MRGRRVDFPLMLVAMLVAIPQSCASPSHRAQMAPQFRPVFMRLSLTWCTILRALVHDRSELPNPGLKIPGRLADKRKADNRCGDGPLAGREIARAKAHSEAVLQKWGKRDGRRTDQARSEGTFAPRGACWRWTGVKLECTSLARLFAVSVLTHRTDQTFRELTKLASARTKQASNDSNYASAGCGFLGIGSPAVLAIDTMFAPSSFLIGGPSGRVLLARLRHSPFGVGDDYVL